MLHKDDLGRAGEQRAADHLISRGYALLDRNWRCAGGELDIVATRGGVLAVVEVKTRSSARYGHPLEAIDDAKLARLWRLGFAWAQRHPDLARGRRIRVDAIAVLGSDPASARLEHLEGLR